MASPGSALAALPGFEAGAIPVAGEERLTREEAAQFRSGEVAAFELAVAHDVQQGIEGRAGASEAAVVEIHLGDALLGSDNIVEAVHKGVQALEFGPQHLLGEHRAGMIEDAAEEGVNEPGVDAVAEAAGQHAFALMFEVLALFEEVVGDQVTGVTFGGAHPAPDLGDQKADVVINPDARSDVTGGGDERVMAGEQP